MAFRSELLRPCYTQSGTTNVGYTSFHERIALDLVDGDIETFTDGNRGSEIEREVRCWGDSWTLPEPNYCMLLEYGFFRRRYRGEITC